MKPMSNNFHQPVSFETPRRLRTRTLKTPRIAGFSCRAWLAVTGIALILSGVLFRSTYLITVVSGESMFPTLQSGDLLLVDKRAYDQVEPVRGDLVVARYAGGLIVKRVVGLPDEEVEVKQGWLYVNGQRVKEDYAILRGGLPVGQGKLLPGDFATLGDNRAVSSDTAVHPIVTKAEILGKVVGVLQTGRLKTTSQEMGSSGSVSSRVGAS
jgi:signal peptidase I